MTNKFFVDTTHSTQPFSPEELARHRAMFEVVSADYGDIKEMIKVVEGFKSIGKVMTWIAGVFASGATIGAVIKLGGFLQ